MFAWCTIGQLDETAMFCATTQIPKETKALLMYAFSDAVMIIKHQNTRTSISAKLLPN
jgi:hypothetical protein